MILDLREINCSVLGNYSFAETSILEEPKNWKNFLDFDETDADFIILVIVTL